MSSLLLKRKNIRITNKGLVILLSQTDFPTKPKEHAVILGNILDLGLYFQSKIPEKQRAKLMNGTEDTYEERMHKIARIVLKSIEKEAGNE